MERFLVSIICCSAPGTKEFRRLKPIGEKESHHIWEVFPSIASGRRGPLLLLFCSDPIPFQVCIARVQRVPASPSPKRVPSRPRKIQRSRLVPSSSRSTEIGKSSNKNYWSAAEIENSEIISLENNFCCNRKSAAESSWTSAEYLSENLKYCPRSL